MNTTRLEKRKNRRTLIDGRLVATHLAPTQHGTQSGYDYHYCRCMTCTDAKRTRHVSTPNRLTVEQERELDHLVYEYEHMTGFGYGHKWACKRLSMDPEAVQRRLERNGYSHLIATS